MTYLTNPHQIVQLYVPPDSMMNKDFLKEILQDSKKLMPHKDLRQINVPKYDELSIKNIFPMIEKDEEIMRYFPSKLPKGRIPDREYLFNILNTLRPDYVSKIIKHAHEQRNSTSDKEKEAEYIRVSESW